MKKSTNFAQLSTFFVGFYKRLGIQKSCIEVITSHIVLNCIIWSENLSSGTYISYLFEKTNWGKRGLTPKNLFSATTFTLVFPDVHCAFDYFPASREEDTSHLRKKQKGRCRIKTLRRHPPFGYKYRISLDGSRVSIHYRRIYYRQTTTAILYWVYHGYLFTIQFNSAMHSYNFFPWAIEKKIIKQNLNKKIFFSSLSSTLFKKYLVFFIKIKINFYTIQNYEIDYIFGNLNI